MTVRKNECFNEPLTKFVKESTNQCTQQDQHGKLVLVWAMFATRGNMLLTTDPHALW